jgi:hypothetical protein
MIKTLTFAAASLLCTHLHAATTLDLNAFNCTGVCGTSGANGDVVASPLGGSYGYVTTNGSTSFSGLVSPVAVASTKGVNTNGSKAVSQVFSTTGTISAWFNYVSTDGNGFADYAWARVIDANNDNPLFNTVAWLFTARSTNSGKNKIVPGDLDFAVPTSTIANYASYQFTELDGKNGQFVHWDPLGEYSGTCWESNKSNGGCGYTGWLNAQVTVAPGNYRLEVGVSNFSDTLFDSGLAFDIAALAAPVPEPGAWALMLGGLALLAAKCRRQRVGDGKPRCVARADCVVLQPC